MAGFRLIVVVLIAALLVEVGVPSSTGERSVPSRAVGGLRPTHVAGPSHSSQRPPLRPGTVLQAESLVAEEYADPEHGFALANVSYETYPAATVDGGRTWRTDGPFFPIPIIQARGAAQQSGSAGPRTYFASQGLQGVTVVEGTTDAGKRWWQTVLPGGAVYVGAFEGELTAIVAGTSGDAQEPSVTFWAFHSKTGEHWTYDDNLTPIS
jgi:hypothetical protein